MSFSFYSFLLSLFCCTDWEMINHLCSFLVAFSYWTCRPTCFIPANCFMLKRTIFEFVDWTDWWIIMYQVDLQRENPITAVWVAFVIEQRYMGACYKKFSIFYCIRSVFNQQQPNFSIFLECTRCFQGFLFFKFRLFQYFSHMSLVNERLFQDLHKCLDIRHSERDL